jgi:hypothetical protein
MSNELHYRLGLKLPAIPKVNFVVYWVNLASLGCSENSSIMLRWDIPPLQPPGEHGKPMRWMVRQCLTAETSIIFDYGAMERYRHKDVQVLADPEASRRSPIAGKGTPRVTICGDASNTRQS